MASTIQRVKRYLLKTLGGWDLENSSIFLSKRRSGKEISSLYYWRVCSYPRGSKRNSSVSLLIEPLSNRPP